jgi:peptide-methionine (R)-S-oxide reductase
MVMEKITLSEEEWRDKLTPQQYQVLREAGTERAFTGELDAEKRDGEFFCAGCNTKLFDSAKKFDSGCGWPSFTETVANDVVTEIEDVSHGMRRIEIRCSTCDGHLGHVFPDGPAENGLRYCMNSAALGFEKSD